VLGTAHRVKLRGEEAAAQGDRRDMVEQHDVAVAPFLLIALIADGEIERSATLLDGVLQQMGACARHRAVFGQLAAVIARQQVIVRAAENHAEIDGCSLRNRRRAG